MHHQALPEGHVGVLRAHAELLEEAYHVGVIILVKYHKPSAAEDMSQHARERGGRLAMSLPGQRRTKGCRAREHEDIRL